MRSWGWNEGHYGLNAFYLGSLLDDPDTNDPVLANTTPKQGDLRNATDTIFAADSVNGWQKATTLGEQLKGIGYLRPGYVLPTQNYGMPDARNRGSVNVTWADGHASGVSVDDPDNPYGEDELTDATDTTQLTNKWDRD